MIRKFNEFNESLYQETYQKEVKCPSCKSEESQFLGPSDYKRNDNGDYIRVMGYKCKKCGQTYGVLKD